MHSVKDFKPVKRQRDRAAELLQEFLDKARAHRGTVTSLRLPAGGLESGNWLAIIGIGKPTRIQMTVGGLPQNPRFAINEDQYVDTWTDDDSSRRTGDSTVPLAGAIPPFLDESQPVCVAPEDFGFFEAEDRLLMGVAGLHAALPSMNLVQRLVLKHFRPTFGGDFKGRRVPGATQWNPPIDSLREA